MGVDEVIALEKRPSQVHWPDPSVYFDALADLRAYLRVTETLLEIENPHLVDSGSITGLSWLKSTAEPEHTEFRDDRFVAAFNFANVRTTNENNSIEGDAVTTPDDSAIATPDGTAQKKPPPVSATLAYIVRAVSPGTFVHPAATVEDMYRPERYARTAAGTSVETTLSVASTATTKPRRSKISRTATYARAMSSLVAPVSSAAR